MGENSKIEWTDHTFNPWRGCTKVSPGCANCYAEKQAKRNPKVLGVWGDNGTRVEASEAMWREPVKWDAAAKAAGVKARVFCASMADVFEDRPELVVPRRRLWNLIEETPNLIWLLLTKRPENITTIIERSPAPWNRWPHNAWLGVSVENQEAADTRIPIAICLKGLRNLPGIFLSCEPLLGPVRLAPAFDFRDQWGIDWVIVGGESGPNARPMHPDWARGLRDQCVAHGVPFLFKQWGEWLPLSHADHRHGGLSLDLGDEHMIRVGKHDAGRILDCITWDGLPEGFGR